MATLNLGRIKPVFQGAYNGSTAYVVDDIVTFGDETFICIQASTGNATSNASYWTKLAAKGTDGTDVGATLTTQGDILYRDASGLQRLPKGTANQVLKMNSGATAPEYGNLSSDFVRVATYNLASATTTWVLDNIFSSTYDQYQIILNIRTGDNNHNLFMRFLDNSGSEISGSSYRSFAGGAEQTSSQGNNTQARGRWDNDSFQLTGAGGSFGSHGTPDAVNYQATFWTYKPNEATAYGSRKSIYGTTWFNAHTDGRLMVNYFGGYYNASDTQSRGLSLFSDNSNGIGTNSNVLVYGLKSS